MRETADAVVARIPILGFDFSAGLSETVSSDLNHPFRGHHREQRVWCSVIAPTPVEPWGPGAA
jgi:hypothetical protein